MTVSTITDLYARWINEANEAVAELRGRVKAAKHNEQHCCDVLNHALEAVMSLEHAVCSGLFTTLQKQQLPDIVAALLSTIELAQAIVQVSMLMMVRPVETAGTQPFLCLFGCR